MNKKVFADYISDKHSCTRKEARHIVDMFTSSVTSALAEGKEISLIGFASFSTSKIPARDGRNPRTGQPMTCIVYWQSKEIARILTEYESEAKNYDLSLLEHMSVHGHQSQQC